MTLFLNCELVSRSKLCLVCDLVFSYILYVKDCPKMRNLPVVKIFLRSYENVDH